MSPEKKAVRRLERKITNTLASELNAVAPLVAALPAPGEPPAPSPAEIEPSAEDLARASHRDEEQVSRAARPRRGDYPVKQASYLPDIHRTLPHSLEAEKGAICSAFLNPENMGMMFDAMGVTAGHFYSEAHQAIVRTGLRMAEDGEFRGLTSTVDDRHALFLKLANSLKAAGDLEKAGGSAEIATILGLLPTASNADYYFGIVREKFLRRLMIQKSTEFAGRAYDEQGDFKPILDEFEIMARELGVGATEGAPNTPSTLTVRTVGDILSMEFDDSDDYFADRVIAEGQAVTVLGPGGVGKSRLMLQMALCMITGRPFLNIDTHARGKKWLFLQAENSNRRLKNDLGMMMTGLRFAKDDVQLVDASLFLHTLETDSDTFMDLENTDDLTQIRRLVDTYQPDIVLFDPLNTFSNLDLNSDRDMRVLIGAITKTVKRGNPNRVPLVLHHSLTGKAGAARAVGWDKSSYGRNSKALFAWTRAQINIAPRDPDKPSELVVTCGKNNNGKMFADIGVVFDDQIGLYRVDQAFDSDEFRENVGLEEGKKKKAMPTPAQVADVFDNPILKARLTELLKDRYEISPATAYRAIDNAVNKKTICTKAVRGKKVEYYKPAT